MEQMEDGFGEALLKGEVGRDRTACYSGRVSRTQLYLRMTVQGSGRIYGGFVPDKVPDREAGINRSGNTGFARLL